MGEAGAGRYLHYASCPHLQGEEVSRGQGAGIKVRIYMFREQNAGSIRYLELLLGHELLDLGLRHTPDSAPRLPDELSAPGHGTHHGGGGLLAAPRLQQSLLQLLLLQLLLENGLLLQGRQCLGGQLPLQRKRVTQA